MGVTTQSKPLTNGDGIKGLNQYKYSVTGAALTYTANPTVDMTCIEIESALSNLPVRVQLIGKNAVGADILYSPFIYRPGTTKSYTFDEFIKPTSTNQTQVIDRAVFTVLKPDEVTVAVAADVTTPFDINVEFQNA